MSTADTIDLEAAITGTTDVEPDIDPRIEIPDEPDHDPLFSTLTGKTYKSERGKKIAESRARNKASGHSPAPRASSTKLKAQITSFYENVATVVGMFSPADGQVIMAHSAPCGEAMAEWAETDPRVRAALERMMTGSAWTKVAFLHGSMGLAIAANHGINPLAGLMGNGQS
jgi:uncharacterized protein YciI